MNANNSQGMPSQPIIGAQNTPAIPQSAIIHIDIESGGVGAGGGGTSTTMRPTQLSVTTSNNTAYPAGSLGSLGGGHVGRLMDNIRRAMLPTTTTTETSHAARILNRAQSVDSSNVLAHHRYAPFRNNSANSHENVTGGGAGIGPEHIVLGSSPLHNSPSGELNLPQGGLQDDQPPPIPPRQPTGGTPPDDENQRNVETFTDALAQHPELRNFVIAVLKTLPFVAIVLLKLSYDNMHSLINVAFLGGIFLHSNLHLKKEIPKKQQCSRKKLIFLLAIIALGLLIKLTDEEYLLEILGLMSYRTMHTVPSLLYNLLMADLCVKCITVGTKAVFTMLPERMVEFKGRVSDESFDFE